MATYVRGTFDGSSAIINIPFGYLDKSHVSVNLAGVLLDPATAYVWNSDAQIEILGGNPVAGSRFVAQRLTPAIPLVDFQPGNLDVRDLNFASLQAIYIAEEGRDAAFDIAHRGWVTSGLGAGGQITKGTLGQLLQFNSSGDLVPTSVIPDPVSGTGLMLAGTYDPEGKSRDVFDPGVAKGSGGYMGAVGDGVTNDATLYALVEAGQDSVFLGPGKVYNLGASFNSKPVYGPGKLKLGADVYSGFQLAYDPYRTLLSFIPDSYYRKTGLFPSAGAHLSTVVSPGGTTNLTALNRSTLLGNTNAPDAVALNRVELLGDGAGRRMRFGERNVLLGAISGEQLGTPDMSQHNYYIDGGGFIPGQVGWNYQNFETKNPGIGAKIAAYIATNPFATQTTDVRGLVGVGRDTFNGSIKGVNSTAVGYLAAASNLEPNGITAIGTQANHQGIFTSNSWFGGLLAAYQWQEGTRLTVTGYQAGQSSIRGDRATLYGAFAGSDAGEISDSLLLGFSAGNGLQDASGVAVTTLANVLAIANGNGAPLLGGRFADKVAGVNIMPSRIRGKYHIVEDGYFGSDQAAHANADTLIVENNGNVGITGRSINLGQFSIFHGLPGAPNKHGLIFADASGASAGTATIRVGGGDRFSIGNGVMSHDSLPTSNPGAGTKRFWVDTSAGNVVKYAA